jgi:hypothetical protein
VLQYSAHVEVCLDVTELRVSSGGLLGVYYRSEAVGELYTYLPLTPENSAQLSAVPPRSIENSDYGFSVGRGAFDFNRAVSGWTTVAFRLKLNDVGSNNGK